MILFLAFCSIFCFYDSCKLPEIRKRAKKGLQMLSVSLNILFKYLVQILRFQSRIAFNTVLRCTVRAFSEDAAGAERSSGWLGVGVDAWSGSSDGRAPWGRTLEWGGAAAHQLSTNPHRASSTPAPCAHQQTSTSLRLLAARAQRHRAGPACLSTHRSGYWWSLLQYLVL